MSLNRFTSSSKPLTTYFLRGGVLSFNKEGEPQVGIDKRYNCNLVIPVASRLVRTWATISSGGDQGGGGDGYIDGIDVITLKHRTANVDDDSTEIGTILITPATLVGSLYGSNPDVFSNVFSAGDLLSLESDGGYHSLMEGTTPGETGCWFDVVVEMSINVF